MKTTGIRLDSCFSRRLLDEPLNIFRTRSSVHRCCRNKELRQRHHVDHESTLGLRQLLDSAAHSQPIFVSVGRFHSVYICKPFPQA